MRTIILASASPRRHALLKRLSLPFQVRIAEVDEQPLPGEIPEQTVRRLSRLKATVVARGLSGASDAGDECVIIAADTLVVLDGQVLGKPRDADEALAILRRLQGRAHQVVSGLTVLETPANRMLTATVTSVVWMRDYAEAEIAAYVATGDPLDKAGAYAVQHGDFRPVERVDGCPLNVMGLALCRLDEMLRRLGALVHATPAQDCKPPQHCELAAEFIP